LLLKQVPLNFYESKKSGLCEDNHTPHITETEIGGMLYIMTKKITPKKFSLIVEELVMTKRMTHLEAIMYYCEQNNLEAHTITRWIDKGMREKIQSNAEDLNYLPKSSSLF
tara:strand:+ start:996 stop:1328 length:333 start_codon:yes stop_codon:yes gene_type:complete